MSKILSNPSSQCSGVWKSVTVHCDYTHSAESQVVLQSDFGVSHLSLTSQASQLPAQLSALSQTFNIAAPVTTHGLNNHLKTNVTLSFVAQLCLATLLRDKIASVTWRVVQLLNSCKTPFPNRAVLYSVQLRREKAVNAGWSVLVYAIKLLYATCTVAHCNFADVTSA